MASYQVLDFIKSLKDPRRKQGVRHSFENIMIIMLMSILSGHQGIRGFSRFAKANEQELGEVLKMKHGIPKFSTFQAMFLELDSQLLVTKFIAWVKGYASESDDYIALDGKAIKATTSGGNTSLQNFVAVVNAFGHQSGLVYGMQSYENGKAGEGQSLRDLVEQLGLSNKLFTMDAQHTQKKHSS